MSKLMASEVNNTLLAAGVRRAARYRLARTVLCASVSAVIGACGGGSSAPASAPDKLLSAIKADEKSGGIFNMYDMYVSDASGSDANPGTQDRPFKTIQRAADEALSPGTTVHVAPGVYAEHIISSANGSSNGRIVYTSDSPGGAQIVAPANSTIGILWQSKGDNTDIVGFDVSARGSASVHTGIEISGGYSSARNNDVHHIGKLPLNCTNVVGAGIKSASDPFVKGHTDVIANRVHDIGQGASCSIQGIYMATSGKITNNLINNIGWAGILLWRDGREVDIAYNTVFSSLYGIVYGTGNLHYSALPADYISVSNNIIYDNTTGIRNANLGKLGMHNTILNNLVYKNTTDWMTSTPHEDDIADEPDFVDYRRDGSGDYRLKASSRAVDKGLAPNAPLTDIVGTARPQGNGPDLGAFEFIDQAPPPSPDPVTTYHIYVSADGDDSNAGTSREKPLATFKKALTLVKPDTTVHFNEGEYTDVVTNVDGSATKRIRYVSEGNTRTKIIGTGTESSWKNNGDYTDIVGFEVTGSGRLGIVNYASHTGISRNYVHDLTVSGGCTTNGGAGIVNANGDASEGDIIGNEIHNIGVPGSCNGIHGIYTSNLGGKIMNNKVYRNSSYGIHMWHGARSVIVANNTVFANGGVTPNGGILGGGIIMGNGDSGAVLFDNSFIINNIVYDNAGVGMREYCYDNVPCIGKNNLYANNLVYGNNRDFALLDGKAVDTVASPPDFVDYQQDGRGDYHLRSTSKAIDSGLSMNAPSSDFDGKARPRGAAHDIGAYEY